MRVAAYLFAAVFTLGAVVQFNDPDPAIWIAGYAVGAGLSFAAALGHRLFIAHAIAAIVFCFWFATIASSLVGAPDEAFTSFKMQAESHEEPREAAGLALLCLWNVALAISAHNNAAAAVGED